MTRLVAVCGLPGTGKTTVAEAIAERLDAERLRTDVVRKELFPDPQYTEEEVSAVYREVLDRARDRLELDESVVVDATFQDVRYREWAREAAAESGADFELVAVECDEDVARDRIRARTEGESDADVDVYDLFAETFDPVEMDHVTVDNSGDLDATYRQVDEYFG